MFPARRAGLSPLTSRVPRDPELWVYCPTRGLHRHIFRHDAIFYKTDHTVLGILVKFLGMVQIFPSTQTEQNLGEVYWVLFLGIYLVFHYFPGLILFPQRVFNLDRGSVP